MPQINSSILCNDDDNTHTCVGFKRNNWITDNKKEMIKSTVIKHIYTKKANFQID